MVCFWEKGILVPFEELKKIRDATYPNMIILARGPQRCFGDDIYIPRCMARGFQARRPNIPRTAALHIALG